MYQVYKSNSSKGIKSYQSLLKPKEIVLLVGSAIDLFPPTNILTGMAISGLIINVLTNHLSKGKTEIVNLLRNLPFEYINEKCPNYKVVQQIIIDACYPKAPNRIHEAIADLVDKGIIHSIITPNYDLCLESLIPNGKPLIHINQGSDSRKTNSLTRVLFKIHGSVNAKNGMVCRLSEEGIIENWKRKVLSNTLTGRCLVVLGYSGIDFEICPEILQVPLLSLTWNFLNDPNKEKWEMTEYAKRLLVRHNGSSTYGDLSYVLKNLGAKVRKCRFSKKTKVNNLEEFRKKIQNSFSEKELMEWACALFAQPGYAAQTKSTSYRYFEKIDKSSIDFGKYQSFQAEAHFSMGRYKDAVKNCDAASEIFKKNKNKELFYYSEFRKIDSLRCWGKNKKAFKYQKFIRSQLINDKGLKARVKSDLLSKINLQEILLLREEYVKAEILLRKSKARLIQEDIKAKLKDIVDKAKHGNWYDLQQCHLWANRVGIRFKEIYDGPLQPLEDREGYKKLGHVIAEMMSIRDALTKKNLEIDEAEFRKYLDTAQLIQSYSELWKLRQSLKKHFRVKITEKIFWLFPFFFCQYTIPMRIKKVISENRTK